MQVEKARSKTAKTNNSFTTKIVLSAVLWSWLRFACNAPSDEQWIVRCLFVNANAKSDNLYPTTLHIHTQPVYIVCAVGLPSCNLLYITQEVDALENRDDIEKAFGVSGPLKCYRVGKFNGEPKSLFYLYHLYFILEHYKQTTSCNAVRTVSVLLAMLQVSSKGVVYNQHTWFQ